jgi:hypothetical protein
VAHAIDSLDRNSAIRLAKSMRRRARNLELKKGSLKRRGIRLAGAAAGGGLAGLVMQPAIEEYQANQAAIEAGTMEDPRKMMGVDIDAWMALAFAGVSYFELGGELVSDALEGASLGIVGSYTRDLGMQAGAA